MQKLLFTVFLVFSFHQAFAQWIVKHVDEEADDKTIHKLEFFNDTLGYAMGTNGLVLRSEDAGETWQAVNANIDGDIADFAFSQSGDLIATTLDEKGTYRSTNGFDFDLVFLSEEDRSNVECAPNGKLYLSGAEIIYQSLDQGQTWDTVFNVTDNGFQWAKIRDLSFVDQSIGYAVAFGNAQNDGMLYAILMKTVNGGDNWTIEYTYDWNQLGLFGPITFQDEMVGYALSSNQTVKTTDGGQTWNTLSDVGAAVDMAILTGGKLLTVNRPDSYTEPDVTVFLINESADGGASWSNPDYRRGAHLETTHFINDEIGFVAGDYALILKTTTGGGALGDDYPWHLFSGIINTSNAIACTVFPNPAAHTLFFDMKLSSDFQYYIYASSGEMVKHGSVIENSIDIRELISDHYTISLVGDDTVYASTFIVLKD